MQPSELKCRAASFSLRTLHGHARGWLYFGKGRVILHIMWLQIKFLYLKSDIFSNDWGTFVNDIHTEKNINFTT